VWVSQMEKVRGGFGRGCAIYSGVAKQALGKRRQEAERELGLFRAAELHFSSCANQARFIAARGRLLSATNSASCLTCREEIRSIVKDELTTAKELLPLVRADSRIGYESSNQYFYIPQDIVEKVVCCRKILAELE